MEWQDKLEAIKAFSERASVVMRKPNDWYVCADMSIGGDGMLRGSYGNGSTPEEAVENHWQIYSTLAPDRYVVGGPSDKYRARWNGYFWKPVE